MLLILMSVSKECIDCLLVSFAIRYLFFNMCSWSIIMPANELKELIFKPFPKGDQIDAPFYQITLFGKFIKSLT